MLKILLLPSQEYKKIAILNCNNILQRFNQINAALVTIADL